MPIPNLFYGHQDALMGGASPTTLAVGDSWFWYPFDNLPITSSASLPSTSYADFRRGKVWVSAVQRRWLLKSRLVNGYLLSI